MKNIDVLYLPLDERPCNLQFVQRIAKGSPVRVKAPSPKILGNKKIPAEFCQVEKFLLDNAAEAQYAVLSLDMLLYGGIVPSRLHNLSEDQLNLRLQTLQKMKSKNPQLKIFAFALIMRCPAYSSDDEEPDYFAHCGREIFLTGQIKHKMQLHLVDSCEGQQLLQQYSAKTAGFLQDYEKRRQTNKNMLVKIVQHLHNEIDFLLFPQDDSAPFGYTAMDRECLKEHLRSQGLNEVAMCPDADEVAMYPGADEVGMTLVARAVCQHMGVQPKVQCVFAHPNNPNIVPCYEDRPLGQTLPLQIASAGCGLADHNADIVLFCNYPSHVQTDVCSSAKQVEDQRDLDNFCSQIANCKVAVRAVADGAMCNGGEQQMLDILCKKMDLLQLSAYAGWNTSSNTLGTAICQAVFVFFFGKTPQQTKFLAERLVEDVAYCSCVRGRVTQQLCNGKNYFNAGGKNGATAKLVKSQLQHYMQQHLPQVAQHFAVARCTLPWKRMFEVDLTLKKL